MSAVAAVEASLEQLPLLLTVEEAAALLRIGRTLAYELARRYEATAGTDGLPVMRLGGCLRVPTWALAELVSTGRVVCLVPAPANDSPADGTAHGLAAVPSVSETSEFAVDEHRTISQSDPRPSRMHRAEIVQLTLPEPD